MKSVKGGNKNFRKERQKKRELSLTILLSNSGEEGREERGEKRDEEEAFFFPSSSCLPNFLLYLDFFLNSGINFEGLSLLCAVSVAVLGSPPPPPFVPPPIPFSSS